jgi:hypothetical protein
VIHADTEQRLRVLARERALSRLSKSHANLKARPIRSGNMDDTDMVGRIFSDLVDGYEMAQGDRG